MARSIWVSVLLVVIIYAAPARATVGGPETLEVIGFDRHDRKVYLLRQFHDEGDRLPQLEYVLLQGKQRAHLIQVKSWYQGKDRDDTARFEKRLAALRARLMPMPELSSASVRVSQRTVRPIKTPAVYPGDPPWKGHEVEVTAQSGALSGRNRFLVYDETLKIELIGARKIAKGAALALVRFRGIPFEMGYETDAVVVLCARASCRLDG